jgi:hypothetical protein
MLLRTVQMSPQTGTGSAPQILFPHLHWQIPSSVSFHHCGLRKRGRHGAKINQLIHLDCDPRLRPRRPPENSSSINGAHLLPFQRVFAHFSPFQYSPQLSYFCGSAARTAVVVIGPPFLPVHCSISLCQPCSNGKIFEFCAPTPWLHDIG